MDVSLEIEFETDSYGRVEWFHEIKCSHMCRFQTVGLLSLSLFFLLALLSFLIFAFLDVGESGGTRTYYGSMFSQGIYKKFHPITPGHHIFRVCYKSCHIYPTYYFLTPLFLVDFYQAR